MKLSLWKFRMYGAAIAWLLGLSATTAAGADAWLSNPFDSQLLAPTRTALGTLTGIGGAITFPAFHLGYPSTPFGIIAQKTIPLGQTLLPFPQFGSITGTESVDHSQYNAFDILTVQPNRKTRGGLG